MKKLNSLSLCALLTPAITLGVSAALAQESDTRPQGAQTQQRSALPGDAGAQQRAGAGSAQGQQAARSTLIERMPADSIRGEDLIGAALMSRQDENFGTIDDVIMDRRGQVLAVIVGVGGFLGVGERNVAISWDSVERTVDAAGDMVFRVDMTDEALRAAPAFTLSDAAGSQAATSQRGAGAQQQAATQPQAATQQSAAAQQSGAAQQGAAARQRGAAEQGAAAQSAQQRAASESAQQRSDAQSAQQRDAAQATQAQRGAQSTPLQSKPAGAIRAEDLLGSPLMSRQDQNFGPITDALIDQDGQILAVIVGVGGFLGLGQRDVAIAWDSLERTVDEDGDVVFHVDMTDAALRAAPAYRND
jgi:hypothetical protein